MGITITQKDLSPREQRRCKYASSLCTRGSVTHGSMKSSSANFMPDEKVVGSYGISDGYTNIILRYLHLDKKLFDT